MQFLSDKLFDSMWALPLVPAGSLTEASVASRSQRSRQGDVRNFGPSCPQLFHGQNNSAVLILPFLIFLPAQETETAAPAHGAAVPCASSFNLGRSSTSPQPSLTARGLCSKLEPLSERRLRLAARICKDESDTINYMKPNTAVVYVGVDVAKATLQVHVQGRQAELKNALAARAKLCQKLQIVAGAHVVCEATGGYEQDWCVPCIRPRFLSRSSTRRKCGAAAQAKAAAKTDRIDAAMLTDYGQRYQPHPPHRPPRSNANWSR